MLKLIKVRMGMKKLGIKGFSAVEGLLILVITGVIGGVGYYVYNNQNTDVTENDSAVETKQAKGVEESEFSFITKLTSLNEKFSLNVPDGWIFTNDTEIDYAYATDMTFEKGAPARINDEFGHRGGGFTTTSFVIQFSKDSLDSYYSEFEEDGVLKLNSGKEAKRYSQVVDDDELGIPEGSKFYGYEIDYDGGAIIINYLVNPTDTDNRALVEASLKTLSF